MSYPPNPPSGSPAPPGGGPHPLYGGPPAGSVGPGRPGGALPPAPPRRPAPVALAAGILLLMGLVGLAYGIAALVEMPAVVDRFRTVAAGTGAVRSDIETLVGLIRGGAIFSAVIGVGAALLLGSLALGNLRGANGARIATWAICAFGALCGCCGLLVVVLQRAIGLAVTDEATARELVGALGEAYPTWWIVLGGALCAGQALGYLVVAALLALPGANSFYRMSPVPEPPAPPTPPAPPVPPAAPLAPPPAG